MIGIVLYILMIFLVFLSWPLAIYSRFKNDHIGSGAILALVGSYFPCLIGLIAIPATLASKAITTLYGVDDLGWNGIFRLVILIAATVFVLQQVGLFVLRETKEKGGTA